jgi:hypothetical protein
MLLCFCLVIHLELFYRAGRDRDGALSLLIEGGPVDQIALSRTLGVPLSVRYGSILPFTGKRTILEALP